MTPARDRHAVCRHVLVSTRTHDAVTRAATESLLFRVLGHMRRRRWPKDDLPSSPLMENERIERWMTVASDDFVDVGRLFAGTC